MRRWEGWGGGHGEREGGGLEVGGCGWLEFLRLRCGLRCGLGRLLLPESFVRRKRSVRRLDKPIGTYGVAVPAGAAGELRGPFEVVRLGGTFEVRVLEVI